MSTRIRWMIRGSILLIVACTMGWLMVGTGGVFPSPDESANAFFARTFSATGSFCAPEPMNDLAEGMLHPRSIIAPGTCLLPTSFLGFPIIAGVVQWLFGGVSMFFITPCLAIAGIVALWWMVRALTKNELLADVASLLFLTHPAFWYYSGRVMMHNVAFVSLMLIGVALFVYAHHQRNRWIALSGGMIVAIGFSVRLVELPVALLVIGVVGIAYRRTISWRIVLWCGVGAAVVALGYAMVNASVYGSIFTTGYTLPDARSIPALINPDAVTMLPATLSDRLHRIVDLMLPFGFHPRAIVKNVALYGVALYPIASLLALFGAIVAWRSSSYRKAWRTFIVALIVAAAWMGVVYGSWWVVDNPDPRAFTIGNSHARYWLPLFAATSVLAAHALIALRHRIFGTSKAGGVVLAVVMMTIMGLHARVVFGGTDGFVATRAAMHTFVEKRAVILDATESDAVLIVDRADKYLFPHRRVIVPLRSDATYAIIPALLDHAPIYYFGITLPAIDLEHLNEDRFKKDDLEIVHVLTIQEESLYRIDHRSVIDL